MSGLLITVLCVRVQMNREAEVSQCQYTLSRRETFPLTLCEVDV